MWLASNYLSGRTMTLNNDDYKLNFIMTVYPIGNPATNVQAYNYFGTLNFNTPSVKTIKLLEFYVSTAWDYL
jgi:hypothetical protein